MSPPPDSWRLVPYDGDSPFKAVRVRDEARVRAVVDHLRAQECVALLGPPLSEKSHLLYDVAQGLHQTGLYRPLYLDLWRSSSVDEASFFTSLARQVGELLDIDGLDRHPVLPDARAFQNYLFTCLEGQQQHLALLIDHLQALPHDLVHSLLVALRAAYMEHDMAAPSQLVAVVAGGMNLVGLSMGPTSPFNVAKPVVAAALTADQTLALAEATFASLGYRASASALQRIVEWVGGDRYLVPRVCTWSVEKVRHYRRPLVTYAVVDRVVQEHILGGRGQAPLREAIRMIEEDPDTMLDMLYLLDHSHLPRSRCRQMVTRTGIDRLQLSGAVLLEDSQYVIKNRSFRQGLAQHFTSQRVGHILRIAGRWEEAIDYLTPRLVQQASAAWPTRAGEPDTAARPQLLEAVVQSIYATRWPETAYRILAGGLRAGFGLPEVSIYQASRAQGHLELVYPHQSSGTQPAIIDLADPKRVEAQSFLHGDYALRGGGGAARLVVALVAQGRSIGVVVVEHYVEQRDPHELPPDLPDLLRFLGHAATAVEDVLARAAYRRISQAVLSASTVEPATNRVLATVAEALGCDYVALYLLNEPGSMLRMTAGVGQAWSPAWQAQARFDASGEHPAAACLQGDRLLVVRGGDQRLDKAIAERFGLHRFLRVFLPLRAGGNNLGSLELGFAEHMPRIALAEASGGRLVAFADQVAIAVHNMQLLRRTEQALARKVEELTVGQEIQRSMLPGSTPEVPGWEFAAFYREARIVGGDFYDFYRLPGKSQRLGLVVADVADKGVPAALFMVLSRTVIRSTALSGRGPASALLRANELILKDSASNLFLSAVYGVLDVATGRLIYANAGHNRPLWVQAATGRVRELDARGIILGVVEEIELEERRIDLAPGDVLLFYTDGITEAMNARGELFDDDRLQAVLSANQQGSAREILDAIIAAVDTFTAGAEQSDDVTCFVVKRSEWAVEENDG